MIEYKLSLIPLEGVPIFYINITFTHKTLNLVVTIKIVYVYNKILILIIWNTNFYYLNI